MFYMIIKTAYHSIRINVEMNVSVISRGKNQYSTYGTAEKHFSSIIPSHILTNIPSSPHFLLCCTVKSATWLYCSWIVGHLSTDRTIILATYSLCLFSVSIFSLSPSEVSSQRFQASRKNAEIISQQGILREVILKHYIIKISHHIMAKR